MILLVHGWGYDAGFWDPLRKALAPNTALDLGFFGVRDVVIPRDISLLVGHSLGFLWLARQSALQHLPLIGINAFPRFQESDDFKPAVAPRMLDRMRRRLLAEPRAVLGDFWQRAGAPGPDRAPDLAALAQGLDHLANWDERETLRHRAGRVHLIAGSADAIVPPDMTRMAFPQSEIHWLPDGGHVLPRSHTIETARLIREFAS